MPDTIDDARRLIQSRLEDLEAESKLLERALTGLGEGIDSPRRAGRPFKAPAERPSAPPKPRHTSAPRRKRTKRAARGQRRKELLAAIKAQPGARPSDLARVIGIRPTQAHALIAKVHADKLVVKRGSGYFLSARADS